MKNILHLKDDSERPNSPMHSSENNASVLFRRAGLKDIKTLCGLCRQCFPKTLRWQGKCGAARVWWNAAICCRGVEVWIMESRETIEGYCMLVTDETCWNRDKSSNSASILMALSVLLQPRLWGRLSWKLLNRLLKQEEENPASEQPFFGFSLQERVWLEQIAVRPVRQRKGLAGKLLSFCEDRTRDLDRRGIVLRVESDNIPAVRLYRKQGYKLIRKNKSESFYAKSIIH